MVMKDGKFHRARQRNMLADRQAQLEAA